MLLVLWELWALWGLLALRTQPDYFQCMGFHHKARFRRSAGDGLVNIVRAAFRDTAAGFAQHKEIAVIGTGKGGIPQKR